MYPHIFRNKKSRKVIYLIHYTHSNLIFAVAVKRLEFSELTSLQEVKRSFHSSIPSNLLCRDEELTTLSDFLQTSITARQPGALYISGAPGTGKTACLSHIMTTSEVQFLCCDVRIPACIPLFWLDFYYWNQNAHQLWVLWSNISEYLVVQFSVVLSPHTHTHTPSTHTHSFHPHILSPSTHTPSPINSHLPTGAAELC